MVTCQNFTVLAFSLSVSLPSNNFTASFPRNIALTFPPDPWLLKGSIFP